MQVKLNPNNLARISFPGFQKILDYAGSSLDSSVSVAVNSDTDLEYYVYMFTNDASNRQLTFNNDSGTNYGRQYILNLTGTISGNNTTGEHSIFPVCWDSGVGIVQIIAPVGFIKTVFCSTHEYGSGTTISNNLALGGVWNSTANITSIKIAGGTFASGDRVLIFARRS